MHLGRRPALGRWDLEPQNVEQEILNIEVITNTSPVLCSAVRPVRLALLAWRAWWRAGIRYYGFDGLNCPCKALHCEVRTCSDLCANMLHRG